MANSVNKSSWLAVVLLLCVFNSVTKAHREVQQVEGNYDELTRDQLKEVRKLQVAFREIQTTVGQQRNNFNPESSMETVRAIQKKVDWTFGFLNGKLNDAVSLFTLLPSISTKEFCNYKGYEILAKNFALNPIAGHITYTASILYHYARQHAIECLPRYGKRFLWESNAVGVLQILKQSNNYFKGLELDDFTPEEFEHGGEDNEKQAGPQVPFVDANLDTFDIRASGLVKILANMGFELGQQVGDKQAAIGESITDGLLKPCGVFVVKMKDIFAPAKIDLFMYRTSGEQVTMPEFNEKFINGWQTYRICLYFDRADRKDIVSRFTKALEINQA